MMKFAVSFISVSPCSDDLNIGRIVQIVKRTLFEQETFLFKSVENVVGFRKNSGDPMICAICGKAALKPYRVACGPEHSQERARLKRNAKQGRWRARNQTYCKEYMREWCGDNPEKRRQAWKKHYDANRESINDRRRAKRLYAGQLSRAADRLVVLRHGRGHGDLRLRIGGLAARDRVRPGVADRRRAPAAGAGRAHRAHRRGQRVGDSGRAGRRALEDPAHREPLGHR